MNFISIISVLGIMASTAALIIVLSVFNGLQDLVTSNFNRFNPPLKIEAKEGKVFSLSNFQSKISDLEKMEGVKAIEPVLSDLVLITYNEKQALTTLYGISAKYPNLSGFSSMAIDGNFDTSTQSGIVFGAGIAGLLGIELNNFEPVKLYYPKRNKKNLANPIDAFQILQASPIGVFASSTPYDENSVFTSVALAKELFEYDHEVSYIAIYIKENTVINKVQKKIAQIVGDNFTVKNQIQQEALLFKTIQTENLIVFIILGFIFVIAAFNIVGILGMIIIEKKQDISILHTLGAPKTLFNKVFLIVGAMIGILGGCLGMCIGLIFCLIQKFFGIIKLGNINSSYIISSYPVSISPNDFVVTLLLIVTISLLTARLSLGGLKINYLKNKH